MTTNNKLATIIAELDTLESHRRAMLDEYMPIKNRIIELTEEKEKLEEQLLSEEQVQDDKRFDEIIDGWDKQAQDLHDGVKTIEENEAIEMEQLLDEKNNPENYVNSDQ